MRLDLLALEASLGFLLLLSVRERRRGRKKEREKRRKGGREREGEWESGRERRSSKESTCTFVDRINVRMYDN